MDKTIISNDALDKLEASLCRSIPVTGISRSDSVMHVKTNAIDVITGWLSAGLEEASIESSEYDVLLEYERKSCTFVGELRFVNCGDHFINEQLAEKFGGCVSDSTYWVLYNEQRDRCLPGAGMFGYKGDRQPTAEEIIRYIEEIRESE